MQRVASTRITEEQHNKLIELSNITGSSPSALINEAVMKMLGEGQAAEEENVSEQENKIAIDKLRAEISRLEQKIASLPKAEAIEAAFHRQQSIIQEQDTIIKRQSDMLKNHKDRIIEIERIIEIILATPPMISDLYMETRFISLRQYI